MAQVDKMIIAAASKHLVPAGFRRFQNKRIWLKDRGFWLLFIEFQIGPGSSSYLNVGAGWLWSDRQTLSFDHYERVRDFRPIFLEKTDSAEIAARQGLASLDGIENDLLDASLMTESLMHGCSGERFNRPEFNAGMASALFGDPFIASRLLAGVVNFQSEDGGKLFLDAKRFLEALPDRQAFIDLTMEVVTESRRQIGLPATDLSNDEIWSHSRRDWDASLTYRLTSDAQDRALTKETGGLEGAARSTQFFFIQRTVSESGEENT